VVVYYEERKVQMTVSFKIPVKNTDSDAVTTNVATGRAYKVKIGKEYFYFVAHLSQYDITRLTEYNSGHVAVSCLDNWTGNEAQKVGRHSGAS
jgi:hypothetical protein